jgi:tetratricopeptide (TPR) repeat protein
VPVVAAKAGRSKVAGRPKGNDPLRVNEAAVVTASPAVQRDIKNTPANLSGEFDEADVYWKGRKKYFVIVAATTTGGSGNSIPFTKVDATAVSDALTRLGYEQLASLSDETATRENLVTVLQQIQTFPTNAVVVVYYSGHAFAGKDLWLQLYGQSRVGEYLGISMRDLIGSARGDSYKGELSVILDTCYSGRAASTTQLTLKETENTVIFASSAYHQPSYSVVLPSGPEMSAFTYYLIQGLGNDWSKVDGDSDGIIMYPDLVAYIGNNLTEKFRDQALLGPMQPQLFGHSTRNWAGYNSRQAHNFDTQPRRTVRLERMLELQDPEKVTYRLRASPPANAHAYYRALIAIDNDKYEEARRLLEVAEKEALVPLAEIYWARANVDVEEGKLGSARDLFEKAVASSQNQNSDLLVYTAGTNFALGNWIRAEELFKQALELSDPKNDESENAIISLFVLTFLNMIQGDSAEADLYLRRIKEIDPKTLEAQEEGASAAIPVLELFSEVLQGKQDSARRKLDELRRSESWARGSKEWQGMMRSLLQTVETALSSGGEDDASRSVSPEQLSAWDKALHARNTNTLSLLLNQLQILGSLPGAGEESVRTQEVQSLLKRTVAFAAEHQTQKRKRTFEGPNGVREVEVEGSEKQSALESAMLLTLVAQIYLGRQDQPEAERLFIEAIKIQSAEKQTAALNFNPVLQLAGLYEGARRFGEAEVLYKNLLISLREPLGEQNFHAYAVHQRLGGLYETWERWQDAENSYRTSLQLALSAFGVDSMFAINGREALGKFLAGRSQHTEAVQLFEQAIKILEHKGTGSSFMFGDLLSGLYFDLSKSYYHLARYEAAEKSLAKMSSLLSSRSEQNLNDTLACLEWQWATASILKKGDDANLFYTRMINVIESELAKPKPDESLGSEIINLASWYKNWPEWEKSEQLFRLALATEKKIFGPDKPQVAQVWTSWAELHEARTEYATALTYLKTAREIYQKQSPADPAKLSYVVYKLGVGNYYRQDFAQARVLLQESAALLAQVPADARTDNFSKYEWPRDMLGRVERRLGNFEAAKTIMKSVLEVDESVLPRDVQYLISDLLELAAIARLQGDNDEVRRWLTRAQTYLEKIPPGQGISQKAKFAHAKGMLALADGQLKQAEPLLREAVEKGEKDSELDSLTLADFMDDHARILLLRHKDKEAALLQQRAKQIRRVLRDGK